MGKKFPRLHLNRKSWGRKEGREGGRKGGREEGREGGRKEIKKRKRKRKGPGQWGKVLLHCLL
jgi:hypothetical protein